MNQEDVPPIEALAAAVIKQEAANRAQHKAIVELIMKVMDRPFEACENALTECERIEHQKILEGIEQDSPSLAALLDKRGPEHLPESD